MDSNDLPNSIFDIIDKGPFDSLDEALQKEVLNHMSKEEYNDYHQYLSDFQSADKLLEDDLDPEKLSLNNNAARHTETDKLPLGKILFALLLASILSFLIGRASVSNDCESTQNTVIFAYQDTLGSSLAEDTIQRKLWSLFDKEVL